MTSCKLEPVLTHTVCTDHISQQAAEMYSQLHFYSGMITMFAFYLGRNLFKSHKENCNTCLTFLNVSQSK